jgi:hypothetical protein
MKKTAKGQSKIDWSRVDAMTDTEGTPPPRLILTLGR